MRVDNYDARRTRSSYQIQVDCYLMALRSVSFAGRSCRVAWHDPAAGNLVEFLYADMPDIAVGEPVASFDVATNTPESVTVSNNGRRIAVGEPAGVAAIRLLSESLYRLISASDDGVTLHAGAVAANGMGVIFPGQSGAGKTSLICWLLDHGYGYLSDEAVFFQPESLIVHPFVRPLNVKEPARASICAQVDSQAILHANGSSLVPHRILGERYRGEPASLAMIVFPRFRTGAELAITPLSNARCGLRLTECYVNARNLEGHGFHRIAWLARSVPAFALEYGAYNQLDGALDTLLTSVGEDSISPTALHRLVRNVRTASISTSTPPAISPEAAPVDTHAVVPDPTPERGRRKLTIGMAVYDDYDGVYFSAQAIRMFHPEVRDQTEILVVDNHPDGPCAQSLKKLDAWIDGYRYVPNNEVVGTAVRDAVFDAANAEHVLCMDCHVLLIPGALRRLIDYLDAHPGGDLLQGPMLYDDLSSMATHFKPEWRAGMYGVWALDKRGMNLDGDPFEIPMQGLGLFACRKDAWPGFNPAFRGFGGEEGYIHEKFRQAGRRTLCLPFLRWLHRFGRPTGVPYPIHWADRVRNYLIGFAELGLPTDQVEAHFREHLGAGPAEAIFAGLRTELDKR